MKKVMNEWKKWLSETAPTEKEMPQTDKPEGAHKYDRALPDYRRGKMENALKVGIGNYLRGDKTALDSFFRDLDSMGDQEARTRIAKTLVGIHHIYKNRGKYGGLKNIIPASQYYPSQVGFLFDDQPIIRGADPEAAIEPIVKRLKDTEVVQGYLQSGIVPKDIDLKKILSHFISQNAAVRMSDTEKPKTSRFASRAGSLADFYANLPKEE